tara:strand:+ start:152 stop:1147 length:996 start_codon:yes stop_codon:yes gene_type:complete
MNKTELTDVIIIGAGPCGLFGVFQFGLIKLRCRVIDVLPEVGGQCSTIYPKKPIYDIPGSPEVLAGKLIKNLEKQIKTFEPIFSLGEKVLKINKKRNKKIEVITNKGNKYTAKVVVIAGGLGCFEPRKPKIENITEYEKTKIDYFVTEPEKYKNKNVVISGGGDSALDWAMFLAEKKYCKTLTLIHRSEKFRGHLDSVDRIINLSKENKINLILNSQVTNISSEKITINNKQKLNYDFWIPLFGLSPKLGPIAEWGLNLENNKIKVRTYDYKTNLNGVYAIGDINTYKGKLNLILCGFHEAALAAQSAYKYINPDKKFLLKYTTVSGVNKF